MPGHGAWPRSPPSGGRRIPPPRRSSCSAPGPTMPDPTSVPDLALTVNGEPRRLKGPATLLDLLAHLELDPRTVVVELNREIVRRPRLGDTSLADGDHVELVHF